MMPKTTFRRAMAVLFCLGMLKFAVAEPQQKQRENPMTESSPSKTQFPDLPEGLTSFGAAEWGDFMYVYGGHFGRAHEYYIKGQSQDFLRLNLKHPKAWEHLASGPRLQGLAMVAYAGKIYRIGGFAAHNKQGEDQDLWSVADVACYDIAKQKWEDLPGLPAPRSSHDAVALGDRIYVAGGWALKGGKESDWHKSAVMLDLSAKPLEWKKLPEPPFERRALALGTLDGKVYVIGGMQKAGEPTTAVAVFDPETNAWSEGPALIGPPMTGFGPAAFNLGGKLYVSTYEGDLQMLEAGAKSWRKVEKLKDARFFHRMLPLDSKHLLLIGGASMEAGKYKNLEAVPIQP